MRVDVENLITWIVKSKATETFYKKFNFIKVDLYINILGALNLNNFSYF